MDNEQKMKKRNFYLVSGVLTILIGWIFVMVLAGQKDSWQYYWDSDHKSMVDMGTMWGWILVIWGAAELLYAMVLSGSTGSNKVIVDHPEEKVEKVEWIEGEIVGKEWDPEHHQVEWITMRQKNGLTVRLWHYIADDVVYKVGATGLARAQERMITEFIPGEQVK